jgi:hypothetical protein
MVERQGGDSTMKAHHWIAETLCDLSLYCTLNGLSAVAEAVERAAEAFEAELTKSSVDRQVILLRRMICTSLKDPDDVGSVTQNNILQLNAYKRSASVAALCLGPDQ